MKAWVSVLLWLGQKYKSTSEIIIPKINIISMIVFLSVIIQTGSGTIVLLDKYDTLK